MMYIYILSAAEGVGEGEGRDGRGRGPFPQPPFTDWGSEVNRVFSSWRQWRGMAVRGFLGPTRANAELPHPQQT